MNAVPTGSFSSTLDNEGTDDVVIVVVASDVGVMADELLGVVFPVEGDGRDARDGEDRRRVERWDWVMTDCWGYARRVCVLVYQL